MSFYTGEYSSDFYPAMPVVAIQVQWEIDEDGMVLTAIVDSGADNTMIPLSFLEQLDVPKARTALDGRCGRGENGRYSLLGLYSDRHFSASLY